LTAAAPDAFRTGAVLPGSNGAEPETINLRLRLKATTDEGKGRSETKPISGLFPTHRQNADLAEEHLPPSAVLRYRYSVSWQDFSPN
jgi:hypothetical protein